jgi:hypothetical protein
VHFFLAALAYDSLGDSDLLTVYNAYLAWKRVCVTGGSEYQFCKKNFLSQQTLSNIEDLKGQLVVCLVDSGFLPLTEMERTALNKYVLIANLTLRLTDYLELVTLVDVDSFSMFPSEQMLIATTISSPPL